jgi:DNA-binding response OmpR family regulator
VNPQDSTGAVAGQSSLPLHQADRDATVTEVRERKPTKLKVLVVDDEPEFRQLLEYNLSRQDFKVFTAGDGQEALNLAKRVRPDVILLDLMLPDFDGLSLCQLLRGQPFTSNVPVIIISALGGQTIMSRSIALGVRSCLRKPVNLQSLGDHIRTVFQQQ